MSEADRNTHPLILVSRVNGIPLYGAAYVYEDHILLCHAGEENCRRKDVPFGKIVHGWEREDGKVDWVFEAAHTPHGTVLCSNRWGQLLVTHVEHMGHLGAVAVEFVENGCPQDFYQLSSYPGYVGREVYSWKEDEADE